MAAVIFYSDHTTHHRYNIILYANTGVARPRCAHHQQLFACMVKVDLVPSVWLLVAPYIIAGPFQSRKCGYAPACKRSTDLQIGKMRNFSVKRKMKRDKPKPNFSNTNK